MNKDYTFEEYKAELMAEVSDLEAAEMEKWMSSIELEQDLSVVGMSEEATEPVLTEEDLNLIQMYEDSDDEIMARAAQALKAIGEYNPTDSDEEESNADVCVSNADDCGEWLQSHRSSILARVKHYAGYMEGPGYDIDDLAQEASLAIFNAWDSYDPEEQTRSQYCWFIVWNCMRELFRKSLAQKRNFQLTECVDANKFASGFEDAGIDGTITWSSASCKQIPFDDILTAKENLSETMDAIEGQTKEILYLLALGYTQTEIGQMMDRSQPWVSMFIKEGRKTLKQASA